MKFGLIGYGAWGKHHAQAIVNAPGAELVAIAAKTESTATQAQKDYPDLNICTGYQELLKEASIDTVDVVVPNYMHAQIGVAALEAGKNVLLEKPMAIHREECDRLIEARDRNNRVLSIAHDYRTSKQYVRIKELIDNGELGNPMYININLFRNRFRQGSGGWRFSSNNVGSWILEEPVHFFDLVLWYMECYEDPISIFAIGNSNDRDVGLYDNFTCFVRYKNGPCAVISQTLGGFQHHTQVQVVGKEGAARTFWSGALDREKNPTIGFQVRKRGFAFKRGIDECETIELSPDSEGFKLQNQINRVVKAFGEGIAPTPGEEARKRVIICDEAVRSIREGKEVEINF
jgi:myo-inositol 2-dehydrogenase/D-chiro-inositol 1-dehydrogenase